MGKQIEFFMTSEDEAQFLHFAEAQCALRLLRNDFADLSEMTLDVLTDRDTLVYLTCDEFMDRVKTTYTAEAHLHFVDFLDSEVVQFRRCQLTADRLHLKTGRLWFDPRSSTGPKSPEFVKLAEKLIRYIRKNYEKGEHRRYIGPDAAAQRDAGRIHLGIVAKAMTREEALRKLGLPLK